METSIFDKSDICFPSLSCLVIHFGHGDNPIANHTCEHLSCDQRSSKFGLIVLISIWARCTTLCDKVCQ